VLFLSSILAFLAGLTRPEGILLFIVYMVRFLQLPDKKRNIKLLIASIVTILSYPSFVILSSSEFYKPVSVEKLWPKYTFTDFLHVIWSQIIKSLTQIDNVSIMFSFIVLVLVCSSLIIDCRSFTRRELLSYYIWCIVAIICFLMIADFRSFPRLSLQLFPIAWIIARRTRLIIILSFFIPLSIISTILYVCWYPIL